MDYGVTILKGASPWQIFQQKDGKAEVTLSGKYKKIHLSQELPLVFTEVSEQKKTTVKARIAYENSGESVIGWKRCEIIDDENWAVCFKDVPVGGLYRIETYMDYEGWDGLSCTRGDMIHNIGVGDIFVIAGQSNAAGRAKTPIEDSPDLLVHLLKNDGRWDLATHPLNETTNAVHLGHYENHNPGHSPFLHFAKLLKGALNYPIGLVNCAYGGAPLRWWNLDENGALFQNMLEMLGEYDITPKAMLWYQGEAEGFEKSAATYEARFTSFVRQLRDHFGEESFPVFTVQLNRCMTPTTETLDKEWGMVREAQRKLAHSLNGVYVVPATDLSLYDFIHNSSQSNLVVGERLAKAALTELYGKDYNWRAPEVISAQMLTEDSIKISFSGITNWLNPFDVAPELLPFNAEDEEGIVNVIAYEQQDPCMILRFERPLQTGARLHGGWRMNAGPAIPFDCMRMPMLSFYGMKIKPIGEKEDCV